MSSPFNAEQLGHIKRFLQARHEQLQEQLKQSIQLSDKSDQSELSRFDNHIADQATELFEKQRDIALQEHILTQLEQTEAAIDRFNNGEYGYCIACQQPIVYDRLILAPETQYCAEHQPERTSVKYEQVFEKFNYRNNDEREANFFDGEDTTQALYQFGTSAISEYQNYNYEFSEEFDDYYQNGVEALEDFVATDITGKHVYIIPNEAYKHYVAEIEDDSDAES